MSSKYQYLQDDDVFYSLTHNPFALAWSLYCTNYRQLRAHGFGKRGLRQVLLHRLLPGRTDPVMELPTYGDLGLETHKSHLVFDLSRKTVTKLFGPNEDYDTIKREIDNLRTAGQLGIAPVLRRWNLQQRWYEMDYIDGASGWSLAPPNREEFQLLYHRHIEPCLEIMMTAKPPKRLSLEQYLSPAGKYLQVLNLSSLDRETKQSVGEFLHYCLRKLRAHQRHQVTLVFSHGDFLHLNILVEDNRAVVIDWESADFRSILNDFYNYFFSYMYWNAPLTLSAEISDALDTLRHTLSVKCPELSDAIGGQTDVYRYVFYLERLWFLLSRDVAIEQAQELLSRTTSVFRRFETER